MDRNFEGYENDLQVPKVWGRLDLVLKLIAKIQVSVKSSSCLKLRANIFGARFKKENGS
jgi:hypothetical protein